MAENLDHVPSALMIEQSNFTQSLWWKRIKKLIQEIAN